MTHIKKAVILAAGMGTRLLPYSKEMPKEMLPIYVIEQGKVVLKPLLQYIFEQLYNAGIREYCFIVGRGKRRVEDHFTPDWDYVDFLIEKNKEPEAEMMSKFYEMIEDSLIVWINQSKPKGTGDAINRAKKFVGSEYFIAVAGDNVFLGKNIFKELLRYHSELRAPIIAVTRVDEPSKYGIISYEDFRDEIVKVKSIIEKPTEPPSNLANVSTYLFPPEIFDFIDKCPISKRGEIEITDAIQMLVEEYNVYAYEVRNVYWIDVGTPLTYLNAILASVINNGDKNLINSIRSMLNLA